MTGLIILLKLDSNLRFFGAIDREIWWMTSKNNWAPLLYYSKFCVSFQSNRWIQTGVTVPQTLSSGQNGHFLLKFDERPSKATGHLFYTKSSFAQHLKAIGEFKLELQSRDAQFVSKSRIYIARDLEIWHMNLKGNRAPLLCYFKLCALFRSHQLN